MRIRRLKIFQQLLIVLIIAVLLPLFITTLIITNVNQHAVRAELKYSAVMTADSVYQRLNKSIHQKKTSLLFIAKSVEYIRDEARINRFLNEIAGASDSIQALELIDFDENINKSNQYSYFKRSNVEIFPRPKDNAILMYVKLSNNRYLKKEIDIKSIKYELFKYLVNDKRQVYIVDSDNNIIMSYNGGEKQFKALIRDMPDNYNIEEPIIFGRVKNQPHVFLKLAEPDWSIVVVTSKELINYGIIDARSKIITTVVVAAAAIIILGLLYTYSLNANFKQLIKAINAIAAGNYGRKIKLIKDFFTPYEFTYLISKFNDMAERIEESYNELHKANIELSKIDRLKSNLIDTVSHEFRTPLTSIRGYASRLLRNDVNIDEETRIRSLKVIKRQTDRVGRLVDDLLVVPEIESALLRVFPDNINLKDILEDCILSLQHRQARQINLNIDENFPNIIADPDRLVQVVVNLLENAIKYSPEGANIDITIVKNEKFAIITVKNPCSPISSEKLGGLFEKFTRLEDDLTRTTRGTGLGLFIARGLINAMDGEITLNVDNGSFEVTFTLPLAIE